MTTEPRPNEEMNDPQLQHVFLHNTDAANLINDADDDNLPPVPAPTPLRRQSAVTDFESGTLQYLQISTGNILTGSYDLESSTNSDLKLTDGSRNALKTQSILNFLHRGFFSCANELREKFFNRNDQDKDKDRDKGNALAVNSTARITICM